MLYNLNGYSAPGGVQTSGAIQVSDAAAQMAGGGYNPYAGVRADAFLPILQQQADRFGGRRVDANAASLYIQEQLTVVEAVARENVKRELPAFKHIPMPPPGRISPGARTVRHYNTERAGQAKFVSGKGEDLPRVNTGRTPTETPAEMFGLAYGWGYDDILSAMLGGGSLAVEDAITARRSFDEFINQVAWRGGPSGSRNKNWYGLLNHPDIPKIGATTTLTSSSTADAILAMMHAWVTKMVEDTNGVEMPTTMLLPLGRYQYIATTKVTEEAKTILQVFLDQTPFIKEVHPVVDLGLESESKAIIYDPAEDKLALNITLGFTPLPVQVKGLEYVVPVVGKVLRLRTFRPKSILIIDDV